MFGLKKRDVNTHKGDYGRILIISGKTGMGGAPILCAKGALRSGAGLVQISVKPDLLNIVQIGVPEATCILRNDTLANINQYDAIVFGPGIGTMPEEEELLKKVLKNYKGRAVIDADGINILSKADNAKWLADSDCDVIITPHMGEAMRLAGEKGEGLSREEIASYLLEKTGAVVVLKGHNTIVASKDGLWVNSTGNPGMATAGSGDVLAGIIGSFLGQGYSITNAAKLGVYVHGMAGDLAKNHLGEDGIIAGDLCYYTAIAIKNILEE